MDDLNHLWGAKELHKAKMKQQRVIKSNKNHLVSWFFALLMVRKLKQVRIACILAIAIEQ